VELESFEGLGMIPKEILDQGSQGIVKFLLDLFRSPEGDALFRSKIMTVGYESVGKTTLLDCLFPIEGNLVQFEAKLIGKERKNFYFVLRGNHLMKFKDKETYLMSWPTSEPLEEVELENREWKVEEKNQKEDKRLFGIILSPNKKDKQKQPIEIFAERERERQEWLVRLRRVCMNEATHGIAISNPEVNQHPLVAKEMRRRGKGSRLELSVWDFAGQNDYYNNHHYFLSTRTVFLVLFRLDKGEEGLEGLSFWIKSLSAYLDPSASNTEFSIFLIGTFLDRLDVAQRPMRQEREIKIKTICANYGLSEDPYYFEVSCSTLDSISMLEESIYNSMFAHSYMGERVPRSYLIVEKALYELDPARQETPIVHLPVIELQHIIKHCKDQLPLEPDTVKRALSLLSLWGRCVYFDQPKELAEVVILDPRFLTQGILADLFRHDPNIQSRRRNGIIHHSDLKSIWSRFQDKENRDFLLSTFLSLLQKLGVLFVMTEDHPKPFIEQRSIIPSLLPEKPAGVESEKFRKIWPIDPPFNRPIEVERILKFNVLPSELVSRLLSLLHPYIQEGFVWKNEVVILKKMENTQGWIRAELELNRFIVTLRGYDTLQCKALLTWIVEKVEEVGNKHKGIEWTQMFRSPHYHECEIDEQEVMEDFKREKEEKRLVCPVTSLPINAEKLLERAGLIEERRPLPKKG